MSTSVREAKQEARKQIKQRLRGLTPQDMAAQSTYRGCGVLVEAVHHLMQSTLTCRRPDRAPSDLQPIFQLCAYVRHIHTLRKA